MIGLVIVKALLVVLGASATARGVLIAMTNAAGGPDLLNVVLNFASLAILVGGVVMAPKAIRSRAALAQLGEKDQVIATQKQLAEVRSEELKACRERMRDMGFQLDAAQKFEASWRGRYEEQQKYTAQPALEAIQTLLEHTNAEAERRHKELLAVLSKVPADGNGHG